MNFVTIPRRGYLGSCVDRPEVRWALGAVWSRALELAGGRRALIPVLDLANAAAHGADAAAAAVPEPATAEVVRFPSATGFRALRDLRAGDPVLRTYVADDEAAGSSAI